MNILQDKPDTGLVPAASVIAGRKIHAGRSRLAQALMPFYRVRRLRKLVLILCRRLEKSDFFSVTLRAILAKYHRVEVGAYTYGDVLRPGVLPAGSRVGRYCSVGTGLIVRRRDHPIERFAQHPFFYNAGLGFVARDTIQRNEDNPLEIGHDVWIGDRVTIVSGCRRIGNGAVLAAGAVITRDVPPYTIVAGVPARPLRTRFDPESIAWIENSRWWERELDELIRTPPAPLTSAFRYPAPDGDESDETATAPGPRAATPERGGR